MGLAFPALAGVAYTGDYISLTGTPTLGTASQHDVAFFLQTANNLSDIGSQATARTNLGLGTMAIQAASSVAITGGSISGVTIPSPSIGSDPVNKTYADNLVVGLWDFQGAINASTNPNYPAASKGDNYVISVAGKIGGASGLNVDVGDVIIAIADNAGGTQAAVGASWIILEHNLVGALLAANNLSDLTNTATARTNIGLGNVANVDTTNASNISAGTLGDARLSAQVTVQGNSFNGVSQLVQLDGAGKLPAIDGSQLTNLPSSPATTVGGEFAVQFSDNLNHLNGDATKLEFDTHRLLVYSNASNPGGGQVVLYLKAGIDTDAGPKIEFHNDDGTVACAIRTISEAAFETSIVFATGYGGLVDQVKINNSGHMTLINGSLILDGTTGKTLQLTNDVAAPSTSAIGVATDTYGGDTKVLGDPNAWALVKVNGNAYKIPLYS